jgi:TPR repeat protein
MSQSGVCPGLSAYRDLMSGRSGPDREELLGHLRTCAACQGMVRALDDGLPPEADNQDRLLARKVLDRVPAQTNSDASTMAAAADLPAVAATAFLSPAASSGELGGLGGYRVLRVLGKGGMGIVYEAVEEALGRRVALKVMRPDVALNAQHRERFLREAKAAAIVESDHVCPIYRVDEVNGVPFIAMPLLKGEALFARLRPEKRLPIDEVVRIGREVALGLAAAHKCGLVHRDIKPANVWLEAVPVGPPRARILDFGLVHGESDDRLTVPGELMGTLAYLSPEQARGLKVDARADLFSLGVLLYEMLTGGRPFAGTDRLSSLSSLALDTPEPPAALRPDVPAALNDLVVRLLEKDPQKRPASAAEVAARLAGSLEPEETDEQKQYTDEEQETDQKQVTDEQEPPRRAWLVWATLGLVLALGVGLPAYLILRPTRDGQVAKDDLGSKVEPEEEQSTPDKDGKPPPVEDKERHRKAMEKARAAMEAKQYEGAIEAYDDARKHRPNDPEASKGVEEAGRLLAGQHFREGMDAYRGLSRFIDEERALALFRLAAERGHAVAQGWVARLTRLGRGGAHKDEKQAAKLVAEPLPAIRKLAEAGDADAMALLGALYADGLGVEKDDEEAVAWYEKAAKKGDPYAMVSLGLRYANGLGVPENQGQAAVWLARAADKGDADATFELGLILDGDGPLKAEKKAAELYQKAADKGHPAARYNLAVCYEGGLNGLPKDEARAARWYAAAAKQRHVSAAYNLALMHHQGRPGVPKDEWEAAVWFARAADGGKAEAAYMQGVLYRNRANVARDTKKAAELEARAAACFARAADKDQDAAYELAACYENGRGVARSLKEALKWYKKAEALGHPEAKDKVKHLESRKD